MKYETLINNKINDLYKIFILNNQISILLQQRFFCEPCLECVCVLCAFNKHRDHNVETFADSANRQREALIEVIKGCREKTANLEGTVVNMKGLEENFKRVEAEVREKSTEAVMKIRAQERELINRVHEQLGSSFIEYLDNKEHLNLQVKYLIIYVNETNKGQETLHVNILVL